MIFETDTARYELEGMTLTRFGRDGVEVSTDVMEIRFVEAGRRAVVVTTDGRFSLTSRVRWSGPAKPAWGLTG